MPDDQLKHIQSELEEIRKAGLYKEERILLSPQQAHIQDRRGGGAQLLRQQLPGTGE